MPVIPPGTPTLPRTEELMSALSFAYFDKLYGQSTEQYLEMLDLYAHEYLIYRQAIDEAFAAVDEVAFRRIKHKIIYSLHLLDLSGLHHNMEALAPHFSLMEGYERASASQAYREAFDAILEAIGKQRKRVALS